MSASETAESVHDYGSHANYDHCLGLNELKAS